MDNSRIDQAEFISSRFADTITAKFRTGPQNGAELSLVRRCTPPGK